MAQTLIELKSGELAKVVTIAGGRGASLRLAAYGIAPGVVVEKIGTLAGGPVVLKIGQSQIAIGRGLAAKVMVETLVSEDDKQ